MNLTILSTPDSTQTWDPAWQQAMDQIGGIPFPIYVHPDELPIEVRPRVRLGVRCGRCGNAFDVRDGELVLCPECIR